MQAFTQTHHSWRQHGPLRVSRNGRHLVHADGAPFFYLADTAWQLFRCATREEAVFYLEDRASKGFSVIQAVALSEHFSTSEPNVYGHAPLLNGDPASPDVKEGDDYWKHIDFIVAKAAELGLILGFLPTWGDHWADEGAIFTAGNAAAFGEWLGARYREAPLIWILGGDRAVETDQQREILRAMAGGLSKGDQGAHLITFHPKGGAGSGEVFHHEAWLDFNLRQNGHGLEFNPAYEQTAEDYRRTPPKPVIDAQPVYEGHPIGFRAAELGYSVAADVRRAFYWDLFQGACGHAYGHHSVGQWADPQRWKPVNAPLMSWREALDEPGASQMQIGRRLLESRPWEMRIPDDSLIIPDAVPAAVPGAGRYRFVATRDEEGSYGMIYVPVGRAFSVRTSVLQAGVLVAWWFDPRTGEATNIGVFTNQGVERFVPPQLGEEADGVLVLDDATKCYPPPGSVA
jgi:hypothetical protein